MIRQLDLERDCLSEVMYDRNRAFFIHMPVLNQLELDGMILNQISMIVIPDMLGMIIMGHLIIN